MQDETNCDLIQIDVSKFQSGDRVRLSMGFHHSTARANRILNSVRTKSRAVRMNSKMEKRINEDQPDITVFVYGKPQLAIEIVDSN